MDENVGQAVSLLAQLLDGGWVCCHTLMVLDHESVGKETIRTDPIFLLRLVEGELPFFPALLRSGWAVLVKIVSPVTNASHGFSPKTPAHTPQAPSGFSHVSE